LKNPVFFFKKQKNVKKMVKLNDPSTFWNNSKMAQSANKRITIGASFLYPQLKTKDEFIFDTIGRRICKISEKEFMKGYIDLDKIWKESDDKIIEQYRNYTQEIKDENGMLIETKPPLIERFPDPFSGRRGYAGQVGFTNQVNEKLEVLIDIDTQKPKKIIGSLRPPKKGGKGKSYQMWISICAYHNVEDFKWSEDWLKKPDEKVVADDGTIIDVPSEENGEEQIEEYRYVNTSFWVNKKYAKELTSLSNEILKEYPKVESAFVFVFIEKPKPSKNPVYGPSFTLDRLILM
jgi:hypothetical protein